MNFEREYQAPTEQEIRELVDITRICPRALVDPEEFAKVMEMELAK